MPPASFLELVFLLEPVLYSLEVNPLWRQYGGSVCAYLPTYLFADYGDFVQLMAVPRSVCCLG